jgi:molybdopterin-guanine dinucleotide biosynthesis protein A
VAYGFVLVGGLSTRMGRDKALLPIRGIPMALMALRKVETACGRAALVGKDPGAFADLGYPFVEDATPERGALHGLVAALQWSPDEANVVLAADVAAVAPELVVALLERLVASGAPAVVPTDSGHPQPLCAAWAKGALPSLRRAAAAGRLSLRRVLETSGALVLDEAETSRLPGFAPGAFRNVNTPEDYRALEEAGR